MSVGYTFSTVSLFYIVLLAIIYFSKKRIDTVENKIYKWLIISNLFGVILALLCYYTSINLDKLEFINFIVSKGLLVYYLTWATLFTVYVFVVSHNDRTKTNEQKKDIVKKYARIFTILYIILLIFVLILPLYVFNEKGVVYTYGPSANLLYIVIPLYMCSFFVCMLKNLKSLISRKYLPLFFFVVIGTIVTILQKLNPGLLLMTAMETFITFIMYFTIENPDVKMITELNKNRLLVNQTNEEKSNFLFLASTQIREPIKKIQELSKDTSDIKDIETYQELVKQINNLSHSLSFQVDNIMDMSTLSNSNIKLIENKYNLVNLIEKIRIQKEKNIHSGVEFRVNISENLPKYLYGDSKMLEQVISSILNNAIKYTNQGFIELTVNTICKYDMCRLIINVSDSGLGMSIDKVNELLMLDEPLEEKELKRLETGDIDINTIKKLVSKMGGYFTIKSEENRGSEIKIVIDQKIDITDNIIFDKYLKKDKILVASNDMKFVKNITKLIQNKGFEVETSIYANDVLDRIRIKEEFSYIFIDDMLDRRAFEVLKELEKNNKFKIPVVVMLDKDTEFIKEHFLEDGFSDYLLKDEVSSEIERILK